MIRGRSPDTIIRLTLGHMTLCIKLAIPRIINDKHQLARIPPTRSMTFQCSQDLV